MTKVKFNTFRQIKNYTTFCHINLWHFVKPSKINNKVLSRTLGNRQRSFVNLTTQGKN